MCRAEKNRVKQESAAWFYQTGKGLKATVTTVTRAPLHMPRGVRLGEPWLSPHGNNSNVHNDTGKLGRKCCGTGDSTLPGVLLPRSEWFLEDAVINLPKSSTHAMSGLKCSEPVRTRAPDSVTAKVCGYKTSHRE